ncbi:hypothetical protein ABB02_00409 [Clostridiaceae bacterium JG1575]|nr:hypothetical protein ABB02_00409 [Clostridiaceae bacterium JG1575]
MNVKIEGMMCEGCAKRVRQALASVPGVESSKICVAEGLALIQGSPSENAVREAIEGIGYEVLGIEG